MSTIDTSKAISYVDSLFEESIVSTLSEYIKIPNKSPMFDVNWAENGYMDQAIKLVEGWCKENALPGLEVEVIKLDGRTPLLYMELPGEVDDTVLLYGHLDKQPEMVGWADGFGPWTPVLKDGRLYGRGGADDGYAVFSSLTALKVLHEQKHKHARCVVIIECCEESGSYDLPAYIDHLKGRIGTPSLVVCLDSGAGNYEQLWCTTSLRGVLTCDLSVELLREGVHSGDASGIIAGSVRVLRQLLDRLEDSATGLIKAEGLSVQIPRDRIAQAAKVAEVLGDEVWDKFPIHEGIKPVSSDNAELVLNRTWRPALAVTGANGLPAIADAGNVMRPETTVKLSLRLPPTLDHQVAIEELRRLLCEKPAYGAKVSLEHVEGASGWNAPAVSPWLDKSLNSASNQFFGRDAVCMGEGGSIPFMGMLGEKFPEAQFLITGVLGPMSNAHGPNEFLDLPTAKKISCVVAQVLVDHAER